ncbi:MAG: nucleotidyl transferase AbiEii/AbiGii toxin family protein, partial [Cyanobium sp.]
MTFAPRLDILPPAQRRLWPSLSGLASAGFVLYGGTAIALRLGHRVSVDFDFFSDRPLDRAGLRRLLPWLNEATALQDQPGTLTVLSAGGADGQGGVKVSLFGGLSIGRVAEPEPSSDGVALVAAPLDLLATKLKVLLQRAERKDYDDVAVLLASGL